MVATDGGGQERIHLTEKTETAGGAVLVMADDGTLSQKFLQTAVETPVLIFDLSFSLGGHDHDFSAALLPPFSLMFLFGGGCRHRSGGRWLLFGPRFSVLDDLVLVCDEERL